MGFSQIGFPWIVPGILFTSLLSPLGAATHESSGGPHIVTLDPSAGSKNTVQPDDGFTITVHCSHDPDGGSVKVNFYVKGTYVGGRFDVGGRKISYTLESKLLQPGDNEIRVLCLDGQHEWKVPNKWTFTLALNQKPRVAADVYAFDHPVGEYRPGDTLSTRVEIRNSGDVTHQFHVTVRRYDPNANTRENVAQVSKELSPGSRQSFTFTWAVLSQDSQGSYDVEARVLVDQNGRPGDLAAARRQNSAYHVVGEEGANSFKIEVADVQPNQVKPGENVALTFNGRNTGTGTRGVREVIEIRAPSGTVHKKEETTSGVKPESQTIMGITFKTPSTEGTYAVAFGLFDLATGTEYDQRTGSFVVQAGNERPSCERTGEAPSGLKEGDSFTLTVKCKDSDGNLKGGWWEIDDAKAKGESSAGYETVKSHTLALSPGDHSVSYHAYDEKGAESFRVRWAVQIGKSTGGQASSSDGGKESGPAWGAKIDSVEQGPGGTSIGDIQQIRITARNTGTDNTYGGAATYQFHARVNVDGRIVLDKMEPKEVYRDRPTTFSWTFRIERPGTYVYTALVYALDNSQAYAFSNDVPMFTVPGGGSAGQPAGGPLPGESGSNPGESGTTERDRSGPGPGVIAPEIIPGRRVYVLLHGVCSSADNKWRNANANGNAIWSQLVADGQTVVTPTYSPADRGTNDLKSPDEMLSGILQQINERTVSSDKLVIVGHSLGGLLGRMLLTTNLAERVERVVTLDSPDAGLGPKRLLAHLKTTCRDEGWSTWINAYLGNHWKSDIDDWLATPTASDDRVHRIIYGVCPSEATSARCGGNAVVDWGDADWGKALVFASCPSCWGETNLGGTTVLGPIPKKIEYYRNLACQSGAKDVRFSPEPAGITFHSDGSSVFANEILSVVRQQDQPGTSTVSVGDCGLLLSQMAEASAQAVSEGRVGAVFESEPSNKSINDLPLDASGKSWPVQVQPEIALGRASFALTSSDHLGRAVIFKDLDSWPGFADALDYNVRLDNQAVSPAASYEDVLKPKNGVASFFWFLGAGGRELVLAVPHFSTRLLVIEPVFSPETGLVPDVGGADSLPLRKATFGDGLEDAVVTTRVFLAQTPPIWGLNPWVLVFAGVVMLAVLVRLRAARSLQRLAGSIQELRVELKAMEKSHEAGHERVERDIREVRENRLDLQKQQEELRGSMMGWTETIRSLEAEFSQIRKQILELPIEGKTSPLNFPIGLDPKATESDRSASEPTAFSSGELVEGKIRPPGQEAASGETSEPTNEELDSPAQRV